MCPLIADMLSCFGIYPHSQSHRQILNPISCNNLELLGNTKYQFTGQSAVTNIRQDRTRTEGRRDETYHKTPLTMII